MELRAVFSRPVRLTAVLVAASLTGCTAARLPQGSYQVLGKTYVPLPTAEGYVETGTASWYGQDFHGKPTSSGEVYDMYARTSAHKLLPLGTTVKVTNLENGLSSVARINDRGPFVEGRIIDLSYTMACDLDLAERGTATVRVEALAGPDGTRPPGRVLGGPFAWQVGAYTTLDTAQAVADVLRQQYGEVTVEPFRRGSQSFQRVRVGSYPTTGQAQAQRQSIAAMGFNPLLVRRD